MTFGMLSRNIRGNNVKRFSCIDRTCCIGIYSHCFFILFIRKEVFMGTPLWSEEEKKDDKEKEEKKEKEEQVIVDLEDCPFRNM